MKPAGERGRARLAGAPRAEGFERPVLVFDLGGTTLRAAIFDATTDRLANVASLSADRARLPNGNASASNRVERLVDALEWLRRSLRVKPQALLGAVVAFPGPVTVDGRVLAAPTLWPNIPLEPFSLADALGEVWRGLPTAVLNDVTAAGLAYASDRASFCIVTVSSGIGHKIFINGCPITGPGGRGGEIGHVVVDTSPRAPACECGGTGHLAAIASGRAMLSRARRCAVAAPARFDASAAGRATRGDAELLTNEILAAAFRVGDPWATAVIRAGAAPLGRMLATIHSLIGIERFLIVGGFATALGARFCAELAFSAENAAWTLGEDWTSMIAIPLHADTAGLLGAGRYGVKTFSLTSSRLPVATEI